MNQLIAQSRRESNPAKRKQIFGKIQEILADEVPYIPQYKEKYRQGLILAVDDVDVNYSSSFCLSEFLRQHQVQSKQSGGYWPNQGDGLPSTGGPLMKVGKIVRNTLALLGTRPVYAVQRVRSVPGRSFLKRQKDAVAAGGDCLQHPAHGDLLVKADLPAATAPGGWGSYRPPPPRLSPCQWQRFFTLSMGFKGSETDDKGGVGVL